MAAIVGPARRSRATFRRRARGGRRSAVYVEAADGGGCAADGSERVAVEDEAKDGRDGAGGGDNDGESDGGVRRRGWRSRGLLLVLVEAR
jgi:hypothetical protein